MKSENSRRVFGRGAIAVLVAVSAGFLLVGFASGHTPGPRLMGRGPGYFPGYSPQAVCSAPASLPGRTIKVAFRDMGMGQMMGGGVNGRMRLLVSSTTVAAGKVSFVATNLGMRDHELVVLPLADGQSAGQRAVGPDGKVDEGGSLGEASNSCGAGTGEGVHPGSVGWTTLNLAPGRYELVCNLPNHYSNGMYQVIRVTAS